MKVFQKYKIKVAQKEKIRAYFLSDFHLSQFDKDKSKKVEKNVVEFLTSIEEEITHLFLLGDVFDFWYEYKYLVPKGWVRLFGKLANLADRGVKIYYFYGNHDLWFKEYFKKEFNMIFFKRDILCEFGNKNFIIGHGDEVGHKKYLYLWIKWFYRSAFLDFLYTIIPSRIAFWITNAISKSSKKASSKKDLVFLGEDKEYQIIFAKNYSPPEDKKNDYVIFGHRHLPMEIKLDKQNTYINTGDWVSHNSYAFYDGKMTSLKYYKPKS